MAKFSDSGTLKSYEKMSRGVASAAATAALSYIDTKDILKPEYQEIADIISRFKATGDISDDEKKKLDLFNYSMEI